MLPLILNNDLIFLVEQIMLNFNLPFVYDSNFSQNLFEKCSLLFEKGKLIAIVFLSSKSHLGIISSSSTLLKLLIVPSMTLCGKPACKNFVLILAISDWKFEGIFLALCNSPFRFLKFSYSFVIIHGRYIVYIWDGVF